MDQGLFRIRTPDQRTYLPPVSALLDESFTHYRVRTTPEQRSYLNPHSTVLDESLIMSESSAYLMKMNEKLFFNFKKQVLHSPDSSKKGDIDERIRVIIEKINSDEKYVTLSSCSGRTVVVSQSYSSYQKDGCQWVYCSHGEVDESELVESVHATAERGNLILKFEPFILHVACQSLEATKLMLTCALNAGCKNSGIVIGNHDRFTVAVRNTLQMEVPLSFEGNVLVKDEFLQFLASQANEKMFKNWERLRKFERYVDDLLGF